MNGETVVYFDSYRGKYIPKETEIFIGNKYKYKCKLMLNNKRLADFSNFSRNNLKKNDKKCFSVSNNLKLENWKSV